MQDTIARINALAHKSKAEGLTPAEKEEQAELRRKYIENIKAGIRAQVENLSIQNPDGSISKVTKNN